MKKQVMAELMVIIGILIFGCQIGVLAASGDVVAGKDAPSVASPGTKLDLAILFDDTGSLDKEISDLKAKVNDLTNTITSSGIDCRYSLISFKDIVTIKQNWTSDPVVIKRAVDALEARGGDDAPEADLDAIETALSLGFRPDAYRMILDITDERTHYLGDGTAFSEYTIQETIINLTNDNVSYILVGPARVTDPFNPQNDKKEIVYALGENGLFIDIDSDNFSHILDTLMGIITRTYTTGNATLNQMGEERIPTMQGDGVLEGEAVQSGTSMADVPFFSSQKTPDTTDVGPTAQITREPDTMERNQPVLSGVITPDSAKQGDSVQVTISGENFMPDATIRLINGAYSVELQDPQISSSSITGLFVIPSDSQAGSYDLEVMNPGGETVTGENLFIVTEYETLSEPSDNQVTPVLKDQGSSGLVGCEGWEVTSGYHLETRAMDTSPPAERIPHPWCWCNGYPYNKNYQTCVRPGS